MYVKKLCQVIYVMTSAVLKCIVLLQDFGKYPHLRMFVQDYIYTLFCKDEDADIVREFVER